MPGLSGWRRLIYKAVRGPVSLKTACITLRSYITVSCGAEEMTDMFRWTLQGRAEGSSS